VPRADHRGGPQRLATASGLVLLLATAACSSNDAPAGTGDTAVQSSTQVALDTADRFLAAMADEDIDAIADSVAADAVLVHPFTFDGSQDPQVRFEGEDAILGYVETVFSNFATIVWRDEEVHLTDDGATVFIEVKGDFTLARDGSGYDNAYVIRLDISDGEVVRSAEYYNPLIAASALGIPLTLPEG
jgi:ketosteroid isomerase-like protein